MVGFKGVSIILTRCKVFIPAKLCSRETSVKSLALRYNYLKSTEGYLFNFAPFST